MRLQIEIPDELFQHYDQAAGSPISLGEALVAHLVKTRDLASPALEKTLLLRAEDLSSLEQTLECTLTSGKGLAERVARYCAVTVNGIRLGLSPGHLEMLKTQAIRQGVKFDQFLKLTVKKCEELIFRGVAA